MHAITHQRFHLCETTSHTHLKVIIREATVDDAPTIKELHDRSILELCRKDYTTHQLEDWVNYTPVEKYQKRLEMYHSFVAEMNGKMVGYVRWNPATIELCSIFVDPDLTRQGIATKLMKKAYEEVISYGGEKLWLYASLTAVPFYKAEDWEYIEQTMRGHWRAFGWRSQ